MATLGTIDNKGQYLTIGMTGPTSKSKDGEFRIKKEVEEGTPGAIERKWSVGTKSGVKYELAFPFITGNISGIEIVEKKFDDEKKGVNYINVTLDNEFTISAKTTDRVGTALMRTLPTVDLEREVKITPYLSKDGSRRVSIKQGEDFEEKTSDHFFNFETRTSKNGLPEGDIDWDNAEQWEKDKFWSDVDSFLRNFIEENVIPNVPEEVKGIEEEEFPEDDINPEDVPF